MPKIMVTWLGGGEGRERTGDLNSSSGPELMFVISYLLHNPGKLLTLSETQFLCYIQITSTLKLLRGSSEVLHHA